MSPDRFWSYFHEIYESIPHQGPGERQSTERALRLLPTLTPEDRILDIGCGSGAQTIDLARATETLEVAARSQHEIDLDQQHSDVFGYVCFVMQRVI